MHEKSLRNKKLLEFRIYSMRRTAFSICPSPSYPLRPANKHRFQLSGEFNQHPNSTQEM